MHVKSTAAIAALVAAAAVASPTGYGADGPHSEQHQLAGQVPFLAEQPARQTAAQAESNPMYAGSLSLEPFRTLLEPSQYDQLAEHVDSLPERRIIALSERVQDNRLVTEGQKALLTFRGIKFIDVTESVLLEAAAGKASLHIDNNNNKDSSDAAFPKNWTYGRQELQTKFYKNIDTSRMKRFLQAFSSFRTRYYRSSDGRQSQLFLLEKIQQIVSSNENKHLKITAEEFPHPWGQNSIIVKLPANDTANAKGTIVVGAHQDSTNLLPFLSAPGADDDGSGTTTVMEVLHILTQAGYIPRTHNVEFHFYSAEEGGMLGSQAIVNDYQKRVKHAHRGEHVQAMLQMDMTAYVKPGTKERIGIIQDFVSPTLTDFVHRLIDEYNDIPSVQTACNYACSDHSSWTRIGIPSAFAIEATFEDSNTRHIHTSGDTIDVDGFSFDHMAQFVQLATAFVLELSS